MSDVVKRFYCHNNMMNPSACGAYVKYSYCQSLELENKLLKEALEKIEKLALNYSGTKVPILNIKMKALEDGLLKIASGRYTDAKVCMAVASETLSEASKK